MARPPKPRWTLSKRGDELVFRILPNPNPLKSVFLLAALGLCGIVALIGFVFLIDADRSGSLWIAVALFAASTVGTIAALAVFAWNILGLEIITLGRQRLTLRTGLLGCGRNRPFELAGVSELRVEHEAYDLIRRTVRVLLAPLSKGFVTFKHDSTPVNFGKHLMKADAESLVEKLHTLIEEAQASTDESGWPPDVETTPDHAAAYDWTKPDQTAADTVGFLPNTRLSDNLVQLVCVIVGAGIGFVVGLVVGGGMAVVAGLIIGLLVSVLLSGVVLGILRRKRH